MVPACTFELFSDLKRFFLFGYSFLLVLLSVGFLSSLLFSSSEDRFKLSNGIKSNYVTVTLSKYRVKYYSSE